MHVAASDNLSVLHLTIHVELFLSFFGHRLMLPQPSTSQKTQLTTPRLSLDCYMPSPNIDPSPFGLQKRLLAKLFERD